MTRKTNIYIVAFTILLLLLGACSAGISEDEQAVVDACLLEEGLDEKACQCVAKTLAKNTPEEFFAKYAAVLRITSQHGGLDEKFDEMMLNTFDSEEAAAEFTAKMELLLGEKINECKN